LPSPAPAPRERKPRISDPLSGLAEELSRIPGAPEPAEPSPRRMPRLQPAPAAASVADAALKPPADQNLSEMAQRLEAALRRPGKSEDTRTAPPPKTAGEPAPESEAFTPPPPFPRPDMTLRRPLKTDDARAAPPAPPPGEPAAAPSDEALPAMPADPAKGARGKGADAKPAPQKSFYDSLEQEMASLLNRPPSKP
jgi:hypothetical protein